MLKRFTQYLALLASGIIAGSCKPSGFRWRRTRRVWTLALSASWIAFSFHSTAALNLLNDSSFEGPGNNFWGFEASKLTEADFAAESIHGGYSLRWPHVNRLVAWPVENPTTFQQQSILYHQPVTAVPGQQYTLSAWAKTDANSPLTGYIQFLVHDSDRASRKRLLTGPTTTISRQWQRYSYTFTLPSAANNKYVVGIQFFAEGPDARPYPTSPRARGVVDAVQLEQGSLSAYQAPNSMEYGFLPQGDGNAVTWGQPMIIDLFAANTSSSSVSKSVNYEVVDFYGSVVKSGAQSFSLSANSRSKVSLNLGTDLRGHYRILLKDDGVVRSEKSFSTLPPPKTVSGADSIYGIDASTVEFALETSRRLGIKWLRPHHETAWEFVEATRGQFTFPDYAMQSARNKGITPYGFMYRTPRWAQPSGGDTKSMPTTLSGWSNYVYRLVSHYRGQISEFEIYNEPCFQLNSSQYLSLAQQAYGAAKLANPSAKVFGWSGIAASAGNYCYADVQPQLLQSLDFISAHYYPSYAGVKSTGFYDTLLRHKTLVGGGTKALWNTEAGAVGGPSVYQTRGDYEPNDVRNSHAAELAKTWAMHKAAECKMFYYWLNFPNEDQTPGWSSSYSLIEYDSGLKPPATVTAVSSYFLDGGDIRLDQIIWNGDSTSQAVTAYGFKRGSSDHVVIAWLDRTDRTVYLTNPSVPATTRVHDMFGRVLGTFSPGQPLSIAVRTEPVYIEVLNHSSGVDRNFLRQGPVIPDGSVVIQESLTPVGGTTRVEIFGSDRPTPGADELVYHSTVTQTTPLSFPWSTPVYRPTADTVVLLHMDNRSAFGENSTTVHDFSGNNRNGTLLSAGGKTLVYGDSFGQIGGGFKSEGDTFDRAIRVPNGGAFNGMSQFTVSFWVQAGGPGYANRLFSLGDVSGFSLSGASFGARLRESAADIIFRVSDGSTTRERWSSKRFPKGDGFLHHLAFVFDGRASDPNQRRFDLYLDGENVSGSSGSGTTPSRTAPSSSDDLYIAGHGAGGTSFAIDGAIDEFFIEERAMSDAEIKSLVTLQSGRPYYYFVRRTGSSTVNSSVVEQLPGGGAVIPDPGPGNSSPTLSDVPNQSTSVDVPTGTLAFTVGDAETSAGSLVVTAASSDTSLIPASGITLAGSGASRTVRVTPAAGRTGTATVTLTVTDAGGTFATDSFLVNVTGGSSTPGLSNPNPIAIPNVGSGTVYPSSILVSGQSGTLTKVAVTLTGLSHSYPDDLDILLVSPSGQKILLMSDAGGGGPLASVNLIFDDTASASVPDASQISSGAYRPANYGGSDVFGSPAPAAPYDSSLGVLNGSSANGTWSLFVVDDEANDQGSLAGGWSLALSTSPGSSPGALANPAPITIPTQGTANLYPSTLTVSGLPSTLGKVTVTLTGVSHTYADDLDILLISPSGQKVVLLSDAGGSGDLVNATLTFDDAASATAPDATLLTAGTYRPTNYGNVETLPSPAPAGPYTTSLSTLTGSNPNGAWSLYVLDDDAIDGGVIAGGWSLTLTPLTTVANTSTITLPSSGSGSPYPSTVTVSGVIGSLTQVIVALNGVTHTYPDDVDLLLVGPAGQKVVLMSDAGGEGALSSVNITLDSTASGALPDAAQIVSGRYRASNYGTTDSFPAPAPSGPYGALLTDFIGTNPNGVWSLYAVDDEVNDSGSIAAGWTLTLNTSPLPPGGATQDNPNPQDPAPPLSFASVSASPSGQARLVIQGIPGEKYLIEVSSDLENWSPLKQGALEDSSLEVLDDVTPPPNARFYRVQPSS